MNNQRVLTWSVLFLIIFLVAGLSGACSNSATQAPVAAQPAASTPVPVQAAGTPSAAAKPTTLVINCYNAEMATTSQMALEWSKKIEEQTTGRVKFTINYNSSLFGPVETLKSLKAGVADIQIGYTAREDTGKLVLSTFWQVPFWGFPDAKTGTKVFTELYTNYPGLKEEFSGLKIYAPIAYNNIFVYHLTKKPINTVADLKGMKFFTVGLEAKFMAAIGAVPVQVGFTDIYSSMEKGLIEGCALGGGGTLATGILPLLKYHSILSGDIMSPAFQTMLWNPDSWAKLPADIQKVITDLEPWYQETAMAKDNGADMAVLEQGKKMGQLVNTIPYSETEILRTYAKPLQDGWITDVEAKGKPAKALIEEVKRLLVLYAPK